MPDIRLFQTFLLVAKLNNITQAAMQLNFSQPAVSAHIQTLEEHFGVLLFQRVSKKLYITQAGEKLIPYAQNIIASYMAAKEIMSEFKDVDAQIRLAVATTAVIPLLSPILREYQLKTDSLVSVDVCPYLYLAMNGLSEGRYDLAVVHDKIDDRKFIKFDIATEQLVWAARRDIIRNADEQVDVTTYPFIAHTQEGGVYRAKYDFFLKDKKIQPVIEYNDSEAIKNAVVAGLGVGVLTKSLVENYLADGTLIEIKNVPKIEITFSLALRRKSGISSSVASLLQIFAASTGDNRLIQYMKQLHNESLLQ